MFLVARVSREGRVDKYELRRAGVRFKRMCRRRGPSMAMPRSRLQVTASV